MTLVLGGTPATALNLMSFGARGNGSADDTSALSNAMDEANFLGLPLLIPGARVYASDPISKGYAPDIIASAGAQILVNSPAFGPLWSFSGSVGSNITLTGNVAVGSRTIPMPTSGILAGDLIILGQQVTSDAASGNGMRWQGQQCQVLSIDSSAQLTTVEPAIFAYATASTAIAQHVTPIENPRIKGLEFKCASPGTTPQGFVSLSYAKDIDVDIRMTKGAYIGLGMRSCYHGKVRAILRDFIYNSSNGQFAYAVGTSMASAHLNIEVHDRNGAICSYVDGEDSQYGEPMDIEWTGTSHDASVGPWNTHPFGYDIRFVNCHTRNVANSGAGAGADHAIDIRCRYGQVIGGSAWNITNGSGVGQAVNGKDITIRGYHVRGALSFFQASGAMDSLTIEDVRGEDLQSSGLRMAGAIGTLSWSNVRIKNWGIAGVSGESYGFRFFSTVTTGSITDFKAEFPAAGASSTVGQGAANTGNNLQIVSPKTIAVSGTTPWPTIAGWTVTNAQDV